MRDHESSSQLPDAESVLLPWSYTTFYVELCCANDECAGSSAVKIFVTLCASLTPKEMQAKVLFRQVNNGRGEHG